MSMRKKFKVMNPVKVYTKKIQNVRKNPESNQIEKNLGLVILLTKHFCKKTNSFNCFADLVQAGNLGLMRAEKTYDKSKGFKFTTYAGRWIRAYIAKEFNAQINTIQIDIRNKDRAVHVEKYDGYIDQSVEYTYSKIPIINISSEFDYDSKIINRDIETKVFSRIKEVLTPREFDIIYYRYYNDMSYSEIAGNLGYTKQRIGQLCPEILKKLKSDPEILRSYSYILE